jgi:hypothetical protein
MSELLQRITQYIALGLQLLVLYWVVSTLAAWYPLRNFRGPRLAAFSWLWVFKTTAGGKAYQVHMRLQDKYGDKLLRIGPNMLITAEPDIIRRMSAARSRYTKSSWYNAIRMDPYQHTMLSTTDTAFHDSVKATVAAGYAGKDIPGLENDVDTQIRRLKALIRDKYLSTPGATKPMDFGNAASFFAMDSITKIAYGREFGFLAADSDMHGYLKTIGTVASSAAICADVPFLRSIIFSDWMLRLVGPKHTDTIGVGKMMGSVSKLDLLRLCLQDGRLTYQRRTVWRESLSRNAMRRMQRNRRICSYDHPLECIDATRSLPDLKGSFVRHGLDQRQCEAEVLLQIGAGSDTVAGVIRGTMLYVITTPQVYRRLQEEIDEAIASSKVSTPITNAEAKTLPYLQVCHVSCRYSSNKLT